MGNVVSFQNVSKMFKNHQAVREASFKISEGETVAILGPNGAGKSTTILMMLGLLRASKGRIEVFQQQSFDQAVKNRIGVMLQEVSVIDSLKVKEILQLFRSYYSNPLSLEQLMQYTGFDSSEINKFAHKLSGGQKRRLSFALALAGNPDILFLDEPTVGMDLSSRKNFWETIKQLKKSGKTIIFTTHYLQEADDVAERILLFSKGRIIADGSPTSLKTRLSKKLLSFDKNDNISLEILKKSVVITELYESNNRIYIVAEDLDLVLKQLFEMNLPLKNIRIEQGRLEEAFENLTMEGEGKEYA
ncbi:MULTISPECIES: ABC transporter ATP-binding protein [Bacillus]|uniref:ABC transporter ATP-binding protein n=1 Tax=Bacillus TaxID=1386 RepID=UPI0003056099|nr:MULTISPECIES: ABC transporter ATP-binding protein [Bacillus]